MFGLEGWEVGRFGHIYKAELEGGLTPWSPSLLKLDSEKPGSYPV